MSDADVLRAKLADWTHRLGARDVHSINMQIARMLWRSAFYRSINESRRFHAKDADG
jgi:hypothetical protein